MKNPFSSSDPATLTLARHSDGGDAGPFSGRPLSGGRARAPGLGETTARSKWLERVATEDGVSRLVIRRAMTDELTIARLFRVPPEEFTVTRKRLVAHLRETGEAASAAEVAKLPRPTPAVWAINQAAHKDRPAVERLLAAADELKRAQLGRGSTGVVPLAKAYQAAVAALTERSLASFRETGRATTAAFRGRVTGTLMAASTDPKLRKLLQAGQLQREAATVGFEVFGDARPALRVVRRSAPAGGPTPAAAPSRPEEDKDELRKRAESRMRVETARTDVAGAESRVKDLERAAAELRRGAEEARERFQAARRAAESARTELTRARARLLAAEKSAKPR